MTHPWGVEKLVVTAADVGTRFSYTYDWGGFAPIPNVDQFSHFRYLRASSASCTRPVQWVFLEAVNTNLFRQPVKRPCIVGDGVSADPLRRRLFGRGDRCVHQFHHQGPADATGLGPILWTPTSSPYPGTLLARLFPPPGRRSPRTQQTDGHGDHHPGPAERQRRGSPGHLQQWFFHDRGAF